MRGLRRRRLQSIWLALILTACAAGGSSPGTPIPEAGSALPTAGQTEAAAATAVASAVTSIEPPALTDTPDLTPEPTIQAVATEVAKVLTQEPGTPGFSTPTVAATPQIAFIQPTLFSHLLEYPVVSRPGDTLGKVSDLAVQFPEGQILAVVVDSAITGEAIPVPFAAVQPPLMARPSQLEFLGDLGDFEEAPALEADTFNSPQPAWDTVYREYWQNMLPESIPPETIPAEEQIGMASDLIGMSVVDQDAQEPGRVEDLILDRRNGDLQYLVISVGGVLGIGEKWIPAPLSVLEYEGEEGRFVLTVEAGRLAQAPDVDPAQFPEFPASDWDEAIRRYWEQ